VLRLSFLVVGERGVAPKTLRGGGRKVFRPHLARMMRAAAATPERFAAMSRLEICRPGASVCSPSEPTLKTAITPNTKNKPSLVFADCARPKVKTRRNEKCRSLSRCGTPNEFRLGTPRAEPTLAGIIIPVIPVMKNNNSLKRRDVTALSELKNI
jgi:hypothetical protein